MLQQEVSQSKPQTSSSRDLRLSRKQADAWWRLQDNTTTEIVYGGGAGGGKSFLGCVWHIYRRLQYPKTRGLIGRSDLAALEQSTLKTLFDVADLMGYKQGVDFKYNSQKHIILWSNGSETILKDLFLYPSDPDFISLGSTEFTDAFVDEANEISEKAFDILNSRIRYKLHEYGLCPKIMLTCNPGPGWLKEKYIIDSENKVVQLKPYQSVVRALVTDNPDENFVTIYRQQLERMRSEYDMQRLLYGDWDALPEAKNPFAHQYDKTFHERSVKFDPVKQLYISIDFNLNPFAVTFWHYYQSISGYYWEGIDEAEIAQGSIPAMIELIKQKYGPYLHQAILTGDAMGKARSLSEKDNASHYLQLQRGLGLSTHQLKVPGNPTHENSRSDVNDLLYQTKQPNTKYFFSINPDAMPNTCRDFRNVQCDATGAIMKGNRKDLNQRADYIDTARYMINLTAKPILLRLRK
jgi:phage terminase large subunit